MLNKENKKNINYVTANELKTIIEKRHPYVLDIRDLHNYKKNHIIGSVNIPIHHINDRMDEIPKDTDVYVVCNSGVESARAIHILEKYGYTNLINVEDGLSKWSGQLEK